MNIIYRKTCVLCNSPLKPKVSKGPQVPVCIKTSSDNEPVDDLFHDFTISSCEMCGLCQLTDLIPLDILYDKNHVMTQGHIFSEMFINFSKFIKNHAGLSTNFLEIGDPSHKTFKACLDSGLTIDHWTIMDPHKNTDDSPEKVSRISEWYLPESPPNIKVDCIITSHVFEHFYDPGLALRSMTRVSNQLIFSIPNMKSNAVNHRLPPLGMMFQHTFYLDLDIAYAMFKKNGWTITHVEYFKDNSIFLNAERSMSGSLDIRIFFSSEESLLRDVIDRMLCFIKHSSIIYDPIYIFGSHFGTQLLVSYGLLEHCNVLGILDNDVRKKGHRLYGTRLRVFTPMDVLVKFSNIYLLMYPYQSYTDEILEGLASDSISSGCMITYVNN